MAKIIGLEEQKKVLRKIENKIKEVKEINVFFDAIMTEGGGFTLLCVDREKKKHTITLKSQTRQIESMLLEKKQFLANEIINLCSMHHIELTEAELNILDVSVVNDDAQPDFTPKASFDASLESHLEESFD